jgi:hypothetical protein
VPSRVTRKPGEGVPSSRTNALTTFGESGDLAVIVSPERVEAIGVGSSAGRVGGWACAIDAPASKTIEAIPRGDIRTAEQDLELDDDIGIPPEEPSRPTKGDRRTFWFFGSLASGLHTQPSPEQPPPRPGRYPRKKPDIQPCPETTQNARN